MLIHTYIHTYLHTYIHTCLTHHCAFTRRLYHAHTLLHADVIHTNTPALLQSYTHRVSHTYYTNRDAFTQTLLDTKVLHTIWHTDPLTHKPFYTHLYTQSPFTHKHFYTHAFAHGRFYTQTRLHTNTLAEKTLQWAGSSHDSHMTLTRPMLLSNPTHEEAECQWCCGLVSQ